MQNHYINFFYGEVSVVSDIQIDRLSPSKANAVIMLKSCSDARRGKYPPNLVHCCLATSIVFCALSIFKLQIPSIMSWQPGISSLRNKKSIYLHFTTYHKGNLFEENFQF